MSFVIGMIIDGMILMGLLRIFEEDEGSLVTSMIIVFFTTIAINSIALALQDLGLLAVPIAVVVPGAALGIVLSAVYGMEIKRALLCAGAFILIRIMLGIMCFMMW